MTAKEKARYLIDIFNGGICNLLEVENVDNRYGKELALICVDEILKEIQPKSPNDYCSPLVRSRAEYWVLVKQEINNL